MSGARRGATLAELLVALIITSVVAALAAATMLAAERHTRAGAQQSDAERLEEEVESLLRSELRAAAGDSILLRGDTAVELLAHVGSAVVCSGGGHTLALTPSQSSTGAPLSRWRYTPAAGDLLYLFDTALVGWRRYTVDTASTRVDATACQPASGLVTTTDSVQRRPVTRVVLTALLPVPPMPGAPVRVVRRGRWGLVRGTDGSWGLSYRSCDAPSSCGPSQPAAGPLAPPSDTGLRFRVTGGGMLEVRIRAEESRRGGRPPRVIAIAPMGRAVP